MMRLQRWTSLSMILRYSSASRGGVRAGATQVLDAQRQALRARRDRRERVVDLVHDAGCELADGGQLLRVGEPFLRLTPLR